MRKDEFPIIDAFVNAEINKVLQEIREDIYIYESDCVLTECADCDHNVFSSIYSIIRRHERG